MIQEIKKNGFEATPEQKVVLDAIKGHLVSLNDLIEEAFVHRLLPYPNISRGPDGLPVLGAEFVDLDDHLAHLRLKGFPEGEIQQFEADLADFTKERRRN